MKDARKPIIGGGAGTGLSAKCEEAGGIDLIGSSTIPAVIAWRGEARSQACLRMATPTRKSCATWRGKSCPLSSTTPVLAGVNGTDPFCLFDPFLDDLKRLGFSGIRVTQQFGLD